MPWPQRYDPLGSQLLSTLVALAPVVLLLGLLGIQLMLLNQWLFLNV